MSENFRKVRIIAAYMVFISAAFLFLYKVSHPEPTVVSYTINQHTGADATTKVRTICVDSVAYLTYNDGLTAKLHQDGSPYVCINMNGHMIVM